VFPNVEDSSFSIASALWKQASFFLQMSDELVQGWQCQLTKDEFCKGVNDVDNPIQTSLCQIFLKLKNSSSSIKSS
jgi:hypothetical protein